MHIRAASPGKSSAATAVKWRQLYLVLNAYGIGGVGVTVDPLVAEMAMMSSKR